MTKSGESQSTTGLRVITKGQWQSLGIYFGGGGGIITLCVWWMRASPDDTAAQSLGVKGIVFGLMFIAVGVLAARNLIRVARKGQAALDATPTGLDRMVSDFSHQVVSGNQHPQPPEVKASLTPIQPSNWRPETDL
jgi:hypothetical protein